MLIVIEVILFTLLIRLNGSTIPHAMTNLNVLEVNKSSHF